MLALVPPAILALYFLKLRRTPVEVPSTYLWRRTIEDLHVNSLWQRLRKSLLLLLQLLIVALAALALLRPGWRGTQLNGERLIFLIDNSASMAATDGDVSGKTRLEVAREQVGALIDQMDSGMGGMLISFSDQPRVAQEFTQNKRKLREKLTGIEQTFEQSNLLGALQLADGLANPRQVVEAESNVAVSAAEETPTTVYILTDGRFADVTDFALGNLTPIYLPIGSPAAENLAITAVSTRRNELRPEQRQAFAQVSNFSTAVRQVIVELRRDGRLLDAQSIEVPAGESRGATFKLSDTKPGALEARIAADTLVGGIDRLPLDNRAHAAINDETGGRVLVVSPGNKVLEAAFSGATAGRLATIETAPPSVLKDAAHLDLADAGAYDLVVYDQCTPERMPRANTVFIGTLPPQPLAVTNPVIEESGDSNSAAPAASPRVETVSQPQVLDFNRSHPLLAHCELAGVAILSSNLLKVPRGGTLLIDSTEGPIATLAPREGFEDLVLGFSILKQSDGDQLVNTNWYSRLSFPTFWFNVLDYMVRQADESDLERFAPGRPVELRPRSMRDSLTVVHPDGKRSTVRRSPQQTYQFQDTKLPGVYSLQDGEEVLQRFAINLFSTSESDIALRLQADSDPNDNVVSVNGLRIGHEVVAAETAGPARREIWRPVLLIALGVLLFEWYVYNRRVYF